MRSLVIYYSHRGTTAFIARQFFEAFKKIGEAEIFELKYLGGEKNLIIRFLYRFMPSKVKLITVPLDLKDYDCLCLGISVIGGYPSAAIIKYILDCQNIDKTKIICFYVFGLDASAEHCSKYVTGLLNKKNPLQIINIFMPWYEVFKKDFLENNISYALNKIIGS
ncbi:MAG: hypothetical protein NC925_02535 [Candidatus Omnitrophica bacterium]|nr:hypothetical protein [Candidatus Omnitrophota bacterium]